MGVDLNQPEKMLIDAEVITERGPGGAKPIKLILKAYELINFKSL